VLGNEECPITSDMEEIEYSMLYRIGKIENLEPCTELRVSNYSINIIETWTKEESDQED
jgi:hypothetical protein